MNSFNGEIKPKLSKHELILERYKVILESTSNASFIDKDNICFASDNNSSNIISNSFTATPSPNNNKFIKNQSNSQLNLNSLSNTNTNLKFKTFIQNQMQYLDKDHIERKNTNLIDVKNKIEAIKCKYMNTGMNTSNTQRDENSISKYQINKTNSIISNDNYHNPQIELIKMKYNKNIQQDSKEISFKILEEKLNNNLKKDQMIEDNGVNGVKIINNKFNNRENIQKVENGQNFENITENKEDSSYLLNRISYLEDKLSKLQDGNIDNLDNQNKIINSPTNNTAIPNLRHIYKFNDKSLPLEESMTKIKKLRNKNKQKILSIELPCENETGPILNSLINQVVDKLFMKDTDQDKEMGPSTVFENKLNSNFKDAFSLTNTGIKENHNKVNDENISFIPKTQTKIYKLRASSAPKKKITSFEEYVKTVENDEILNKNL